MQSLVGVLLSLALLGSSGIGLRQGPTVDSPPDVFTWAMVGESPHWVVVLHGYGRREQGKVTYVHVKPFVVWTAGGEFPRRYEYAFAVQGVKCGHGSVTRTAAAPIASQRSDILGVCKLVYPRMPSLPGTEPEDFAAAIKNHGRFIFEWNHQRETIQWR